MGKIRDVLRTFEQSPDADMLLASGIALGYFVDPFIGTVVGAAAAKQYIWGHWGYSRAIGYIERDMEKYGKVNEKAIKRAIRAPCEYFGSRYALREFRRNRDKSTL